MSQQERSTNDKPQPAGGTLDKALQLLEYLEQAGAPVGTRGLESATGISKSTAQRLLSVLESHGYVRKRNGKYSLWVGAVRLARSFSNRDTLVRAALPILETLSGIFEETASLYVRQGYDRILIERVESKHPLRFQTPIGDRLPLHLGASGQVLCSGLDDDELREFLKPRSPVYLANGQGLELEDLMNRIRMVRVRGYATGIGERYEGVTSVAAPVNLDGSILAAINVVGPSYRLSEEKLERLALEICGAARELSDVYRRGG